jgi:thioredoxin reductase (NADPH)
MSTFDTRREQMFPKLSPGEIDRLRRFGTVRRFRAGEVLFTTGETRPGMFVIISGSVAVTRREGLGHVVLAETPTVEGPRP